MSTRRAALARGLALGATAWAGAALRAQPGDAGPIHAVHTGDLGWLATVDATLGGAPWRCLLDSGASVAVVSPAVAGRANLRVIDRTRVATAGGTMSIDRVALPPTALAGQALALPQALVLDLAQQLGLPAGTLEGLIGAPALRGRVLRLDLSGRRLQWDPPAQAQATLPRTVWPLRWDQGLPVIELALGDRPPAPFLFDTGNAGALVVFARHAATLLTSVPAGPPVTMRELGGAVTVQQVLLEHLHAPGFTGRDVPLVFETGAAGRRGAHFDRLAGSAGLALFSGGAVTIDGPGGRLIVEQPGLPEPPPLPGGFGFALGGGADGGPVVTAVFDGGPAARAGVRPAQRLRMLDGHDVSAASPSEVWRTLSGVDAAVFGFDGHPTPATLARERFFARWR